MKWKSVAFAGKDGYYQYNGNKLKLSDLFDISMECLTIYLAFAYIRWPTEEDFKYLFAARQALEWIFNSLCWTDITPSNHFMLDHAVTLAEIHKTAYITLQEGTEKKHDFIKNSAHHTFKGAIGHNKQNRYVLILRRLLLISLLHFSGFHHNRLDNKRVIHTSVAEFKLEKIKIFF